MLKNIVFKFWNRKPQNIKHPESIFKKPKKILFLRQDRIGDLIISTPVFKAIKEKFPDSELHILLSKYNSHSYKLCSEHLDNYFVLKKDLFGIINTISEIRKNKYDIIIDLTDNSSTTSTFLVGLSNAKKRLGFDKENSSIYDFTVGPFFKAEVHIAKRLLMLLLPFGIDPHSISHKPQILINKSTIENAKNLYNTEINAVGIILSGSNDSKFWGFENINELLILITNKTDLQVLIYQTPQYPNVKNSLIESPQIKYIMPGKDLEDFAALLTLSSLIVSPDTAAIHLGSALGIKQVALFKVIDKEKYGMPWYPVETPYKVFEESETIKNIKATDVFNAILELIK